MRSDGEAHLIPVFTPPQRARDGEATRALVIDDSELARSFIARLLADAGFEVLTQASAIGATRTIVHNRVRLVVVDVSMPGLNGDKLVGVLRSNPRLAGLTIIVVSGQPSQELERIAAETPADAVLSKTGLEEQLLPLLARLMRTRREGTVPTDPSRRGNP